MYFFSSPLSYCHRQNLHPNPSIDNDAIEDSKLSTYEEEWYKYTPHRVKKKAILTSKSQLYELTLVVMQLVKNKAIQPPGRACGVCVQFEHFIGCIRCCKVNQNKPFGCFMIFGVAKPNKTFLED